MRTKFEKEMEELNDEVKKMGEFIDVTISNAMKALRENDIELARRVAENDHVADEMEMSIEKKSLRILLSQQPVARDLRTISTALKMITDMERICDQAADIADIIANFNGRTAQNYEILFDMAEKCVIMVTKAIDSFIASDAELAKAVIASDDEIDNLFIKVRNDLIQKILSDPESGEFELDCFMISKYLERIGDHAENIAEWVIFSITGEHKNKQIL